MKRILIEVGHPNDVHQFKHLYWELDKMGWPILILAKQKDIVTELLDAFKIPYQVFGRTPDSYYRKILTLPLFHLRYLLKAVKFHPDIILSRISAHSSHMSRILRCYHMGFTDTENVGMLDTISVPFTDIFFTSYSYQKKYPKNHYYYPGYIESWYLHPNRFKPNHRVLEFLGVEENEPYSILRFVSWKAHHDKGIIGLTDEFKIRVVNKLLETGKIFISSEKPLPPPLEKFRFKLSPDMMHDALYYAFFFYGESATMASECAMLGTPAIFIDPRGVGYTDDLEKRFGLVYNYSLDTISLEQSIQRIDEILHSESFKDRYTRSHQQLLSEIIDPTSFIKWFILNYPDSISILKNNPEYCLKFK